MLKYYRNMFVENVRLLNLALWINACMLEFKQFNSLSSSIFVALVTTWLMRRTEVSKVLGYNSVLDNIFNVFSFVLLLLVVVVVMVLLEIIMCHYMFPFLLYSYFNNGTLYIKLIIQIYQTIVYSVFCDVLCVLYGPFCHGAYKLDLSTLFTTFFLWTSLPFILSLLF